MRANSVGKKCTEVERAYLAGLIDGDGSIMATIEKHNEKRFRFRVRIVLKITQKHKVDLVFISKILGFGTVRQNKTTFDWILKDQKQILGVLKSLQPFARIKKQQYKIAIKSLETSINDAKDLIAVARDADALSRFNVRSNNRRMNYVAMIEEHFSSND